MKHQSVTFKLLVIGDSGVGKTSMLMRYCENAFQNDLLSTVGVDFKIKRIQIGDYDVCFNIWDTAGQQRFKNITKSFYKNAQGIVLTYSIDSIQSFNHIENWIEQIKQNTGNQLSLVLVGNKCDLVDNREVTKNQGTQLAKKYGIDFMQVSAKLDQNLSNIFEILGKKIIERTKGKQIEKKSIVVESIVKGTKKDKKKQCCD